MLYLPLTLNLMSKILTTEGLPLETSLKKVEQKNKFRAFLLVLPLLLFLIVAYVWPILNLLTRSVDNRLISDLLPQTAIALSNWEGNELPSEDIYKTFYLDLNEAHKQKLSGKVSTRLNYAKNGFKSLINKTRRKLKNFEDENYKDQFIDLNKKMGRYRILASYESSYAKIHN